MTIQEIFPRPTVREVIFQIRFPNLFYIENKIGDFQLRVMEEFPDSSLISQKQLVFVETGEKGKLEELQKDFERERGKKIWQFRSQKDFNLNVLSDSLDITSRYHKTYRLEGADKFRDIIEFVLNKFFEVVSIPIINRIGLRYIDECPIPSKDNSTFKSYYNSSFPINRFTLKDASEMDFKTVVKKGKHYLRYIESLKKINNKYKLILDFDSFATKVRPSDCLKVTDYLHTLISKEYERTIREPVYEYMRNPRGVRNGNRSKRL